MLFPVALDKHCFFYLFCRISGPDYCGSEQKYQKLTAKDEWLSNSNIDLESEDLDYLYDELFAIAYESQTPERRMNQSNIERPYLILYIRSTCPFCRLVNDYLDSIHKTVPKRDIGKDPAAAKELVKVGGKKQVPCLVINNPSSESKEVIYESKDIIKWFKNNPDKY